MSENECLCVLQAKSLTGKIVSLSAYKNINFVNALISDSPAKQPKITPTNECNTNNETVISNLTVTNESQSLKTIENLYGLSYG